MTKRQLIERQLDCKRYQLQIAEEYGFISLAVMAQNEIADLEAKLHKPREPAQTGTIRNDPEQKDLAYQIGKAIARIIRRVLK